MYFHSGLKETILFYTWITYDVPSKIQATYLIILIHSFQHSSYPVYFGVFLESFVNFW